MSVTSGEKHKALINVLKFGELYTSQSNLAVIRNDLKEYYNESRNLHLSDEEFNECLRFALLLQEKDKNCFMNLTIEGLRAKHAELKLLWSADKYATFLKSEHENSSAIASVLHVFSVLKFLTALGKTCHLWTTQWRLPNTLRWFASIKDEGHLRFWHAEAVMELMMTEQNVDGFRKMAVSITAFAKCSINKLPFDNIEPAETPHILRHFSRRLRGHAAASSMEKAISSLIGASDEKIRYLAMFRVIQLLGEYPYLLSFPGTEIIQRANSRRRLFTNLRSARNELSHICTTEALAHCHFLIQQRNMGSSAENNTKNERLDTLLKKDCLEIQNYLKKVTKEWDDLKNENWNKYHERFKNFKEYDTAVSTPGDRSGASSATDDDSALSRRGKETIGQGISNLCRELNYISLSQKNGIAEAAQPIFQKCKPTDATRKIQKGFSGISGAEKELSPKDSDAKREAIERALKVVRIRRGEDAWKKFIQRLEKMEPTDIAKSLQKESRADFIALVTDAIDVLERVTSDTTLSDVATRTLYALAAQYAVGTFSETWSLREKEDIKDFNELAYYFTKVRNAVFHSITVDETLPVHSSEFTYLTETFPELNDIETSSNMQLIRNTSQIARYCKEYMAGLTH